MNLNKTKSARLFSILTDLQVNSMEGVPFAPTSSAGITLTYRPGATQAQIDAATAALASFDWSDGAHNAWLVATWPEKFGLLNAATNAVANNNAYLGLPSPTQAQAVAQVQALTQQNNRLIKALAKIILNS